MLVDASGFVADQGFEEVGFLGGGPWVGGEGGCLGRGEGWSRCQRGLFES